MRLQLIAHTGSGYHVKNDTGGNCMWFWWIMLFPTIIVHIPFYGKSDGVIGWSGLVICVVECVIMLVSIFPTEKALKNTFNEDGTRKN